LERGDGDIGREGRRRSRDVDVGDDEKILGKKMVVLDLEDERSEGDGERKGKWGEVERLGQSWGGCHRPRGRRRGGVSAGDDLWIKIREEERWSERD